jgi:ectoine hydroxylase-related dioxygenase (phytanoyl-CoA dioxygenase family)
MSQQQQQHHQRILSDQHIEFFRLNGYLVLPNVIPPALLTHMRRECNHLVMSSPYHHNLNTLTRGDTSCDNGEDGDGHGDGDDDDDDGVIMDAMGNEEWEEFVASTGCIIEPHLPATTTTTAATTAATTGAIATTNRTPCGISNVTTHIQQRAAASSSASSSHVARFSTSHWMRLLAGQLLGVIDSVFLFNEQYIVKPPCGLGGAQFRYHQDGEYLVGVASPDPMLNPYVSCWMPLDHVSACNGTLYILPLTAHQATARTTDPELTGQMMETEYTDISANAKIEMEKNEVEVRVPAGSIVVLSSLVLHRSTLNTTVIPRRAFMSQYTKSPVVHIGTDQLVALAVQLADKSPRSSQPGN